MSPRPIDRSQDLRRLRDEGYEVQCREGYLLVGHVPYVNQSKQVKFGTLVSTLQLNDDQTMKPDTHVVHFAGEYPCHNDGAPIAQLHHSSERKQLLEDVVVDHMFSNKPPQGYDNYYEKMTTYVRIISAPAQSLDPSAAAQTFAAVHAATEDSVFEYTDTNSSRADINMIAAKLRDLKVAIVGLGGTGTYVLDLVSKTPVREIHLFDGDRFVQHNAFRSPGAASREDLQRTPLKVDHFKSTYSRMHKGILAHPVFINSDNASQLDVATFVFVCVDRGEPRKIIFDHLEATGIPFIDIGMGVHVADGKLHGIVRTTCSTPTKRDHVRNRVSFGDGADDVYGTNIQIADLNMLNATLAVMRWKKLYGVYDDQEKERHSTYTINVNMLLSDDREA